MSPHCHLPERQLRAPTGPRPSFHPSFCVPSSRSAAAAWRRRAPRQRAAAPPRCSRNAPLTLLIAPAEPGPEDLPGACQLWSGSETAAQTCQRAACGLPAAAALRAAGALSRCQRPAISARTLWLQLAQRPVYSVWVVIGDVRGCQGCWVWRWAGAETWWAVRFEWSTGFGFLTVSAPPPAAFRCQLISQRQSRDHVGPGRTLVCLQRAPGARAVPPPTSPITLYAVYAHLFTARGDLWSTQYVR